MLQVKKRHTRILGTLNKKADKDFINSLVKNGMDGVRVFCDNGYENCKKLIQYTREAAEEHQTRVVFNIEIRCKSSLAQLSNLSRKHKTASWRDRGR